MLTANAVLISVMLWNVSAVVFSNVLGTDSVRCLFRSSLVVTTVQIKPVA